MYFTRTFVALVTSSFAAFTAASPIEDRAPAATRGIQLWVNANYQGSSAVMEFGQLNTCGNVPGFINDRTSSVKLLTATVRCNVYIDANCNGAAIFITGNVPNLSVFNGWNDVISSVKCFQ